MPIVFCIIGALLVGWMGSNRKIGFGWAFVASLFLSPLIGFIITLCSSKIEDTTSNTSADTKNE